MTKKNTIVSQTGSEKMSSSCSYKIETLINEYTDRLLRLALTIVGDYQVAEDVTQEAWLKIHHNLPTFRGDSSIYTWMARITLNLAKNRMRPNFWSRLNTWRDEYTLYFFYYEELKVSEIAELLDISNSAVKLRLMRGRQKLKELLIEQEG